MDKGVKALEDALNASRSLVIYRGIRELPVWSAMEKLLEGVTGGISPHRWWEDYYYFLHLMFSDTLNGANSSNHSITWKEWVLNKVLYFDNSFSRLCEGGTREFSQDIHKVIQHDLHCIRKIGEIPWNQLIDLTPEKTGIGMGYLPVGEEQTDWDTIVNKKGLEDWTPRSLIRYYKEHGAGMFSIYRGFCWNGITLDGIRDTDPITLDQLIGYDIQKQTIMANTEKFVRGYPANNVLLYGDKGTGKSSMVKALIHQYGDEGLRIVELPKVYLADYHQVMEQLENRSFRFILFIDDLSFEEHETEYKYIKALLEGGLKAKPSNVLVYATSNRRHLIREMVSDRSTMGYHYNEENEISPTDSMQEKLSLADRFGITLTFIAPNQKGYLEMVQAMAGTRGLEIDPKELQARALQWEKRFNGRSGRTARQFIDDLEGSL